MAMNSSQCSVYPLCYVILPFLLESISPLFESGMAFVQQNEAEAMSQYL